jgi:hypothetical protein
MEKLIEELINFDFNIEPNWSKISFQDLLIGMSDLSPPGDSTLGKQFIGFFQVDDRILIRLVSRISLVNNPHVH